MQTKEAYNDKVAAVGERGPSVCGPLTYVNDVDMFSALSLLACDRIILFLVAPNTE